MFKESILKLNGYHPQQAACDIILDANESYVNKPYNRYPDPTATALRAKLAILNNVDADEIIAGNGSSELIDLIMKCTLSEMDKMLTFGPTFSIYELNASILGASTITYPLNDDFTLDLEGFIKKMTLENPRLIVICNPNNPTGTVLSKKTIIEILLATEAVVIVDEAYIDFGGESLIDLINKYQNLIVLKTLSKAYGLAGARLGYMLANKSTVEVVNKVRPPYNLSALAQDLGLKILDKRDEMESVIAEIVKARQDLFEALEHYVSTYPSGGNFIFFKSSVETLYEDLLAKGIRIRKYSGSLSGYYRVTVGTKDENKVVIEAMEEIYGA